MIEAERRQKKRTEFLRTRAFIVILINVILFYLLNSVPYMKIGYITNAFNDWLPVANGIIVAGTAMNLILFVLPGPATNKTVEIVSDLFGLVAFYLLFLIFPFSLPSVFTQVDSDLIVKMILIAIIGGIIIEFLIRTSKFIDFLSGERVYE